LAGILPDFFWNFTGFQPGPWTLFWRPKPNSPSKQTLVLCFFFYFLFLLLENTRHVYN
jgi:hypothetical protein